MCVTASVFALSLMNNDVKLSMTICQGSLNGIVDRYA
jgi:hypothetical protein